MRIHPCMVTLIALAVSNCRQAATGPVTGQPSEPDAADHSSPAAPVMGDAGVVPDAEAFAAHTAKLRRILKDEYHVVIEPPFVVIGNESAEMVEARSIRTVRWAVERLRREFFDQDPNEILDIWLFRDKETYESETRRLLKQEPRTPFGYYSPSARALIMNISTGGGTLVHEIVHPFVRANFPKCPAWFNEGLGSLYEQCEDREGRIHGLTNWRLAGLQSAIRSGGVPLFDAFTALSDQQFYEADPGTHYSQARYLCYYLQQQDLLQTYYRQFVASHADDPSGYATLVKVLNEDDMASFHRRWQEFVLGLRFDG